jgi:hypothetical protein
MNRLRLLVVDLWRGRLPLARVFWEFAICYGTLANLVTTLAAFTAFTQGWTLTGIAAFVLPIPYNVLMVVSVWRSAAQYSGPAIWPALARALVLIWAALASLI